MTEVIRLDAVTSVSSVCLSSNNVPRAFSSKWRAGLGGPEGRYVQMTLSPCPKLLSYAACATSAAASQLTRSPRAAGGHFQLMRGFRCIPAAQGGKSQI